MNSSHLILTALIGFLSAPLQGQDSSPSSLDSAYVAGDYRVFTGAGHPATLEDVVAAMGRHEVVFIGESHDDPTGHFLELELLRRAHEAYGMTDVEDEVVRPVAVSLEFFQRDAQPILDEYLAGLITESTFRTDSRPWPRYETDYRPVVEYAKDHGLAVIAANAPRRYVNRATRLGQESLNELSSEALATIAPLPYARASRAYLDQWVQALIAAGEQERMVCGVPIADSTTTEEGAAHRPAPAHGNGSSRI
ncbi:MAG: ChaN family lipoprotein, partial [Gemmatimonadota bacterium]|nr:ChaN family lipoprotein [Gemmatimonadota bacterium]